MIQVSEADFLKFFGDSKEPGEDSKIIIKDDRVVCIFADGVEYTSGMLMFLEYYN